MKGPSPLYGLMAEFDDVSSLVLAAERAYGEGYRSRSSNCTRRSARITHGCRSSC